jgi:hypothetical protein
LQEVPDGSDVSSHMARQAIALRRHCKRRRGWPDRARAAPGSGIFHEGNGSDADQYHTCCRKSLYSREAIYKKRLPVAVRMQGNGRARVRGFGLHVHMTLIAITETT